MNPARPTARSIPPRVRRLHPPIFALDLKTGAGGHEHQVAFGISRHWRPRIQTRCPPDCGGSRIGVDCAETLDGATAQIHDIFSPRAGGC